MGDTDDSKVPKFLRRLYRETCDEENKDIVWSNDGDRIRIVNKEKFIKSTLPCLSRTKEYSAFIRQLNIYGFVKSKSEKNDDIEEYYNCFFKKDEPSLMAYIKRVKKMEKADNKLKQLSIENSIAFLTNANYRMSNEISQLKEKLDKQERTITGLLEILGKVFRTGIQNINTQSKVSEIREEVPLVLGDKEENRAIPKFPIFRKEEKKEDSYVADMNDIFF